MRPSVVVDVVRVCKTKNGPAVMLDEAHPVALPPAAPRRLGADIPPEPLQGHARGT